MCDIISKVMFYSVIKYVRYDIDVFVTLPLTKISSCQLT